jgi:hypothetical protein
MATLQAVSSLEKKLAEEKKQRADFQLKLETERKNKKVTRVLGFVGVSPFYSKYGRYSVATPGKQP